MWRESDERRRIAWERELVEAMRRDDARAFAAFFRAFRPLLMEEARRLGVQPGLRQELVDECLDDVAMGLRQYTRPIPRSLVPYLMKALRIQRALVRRGERRRADGEDAGAEHADLGVPMSTVASVSESTLRASAGADREPAPASTALERLASMVEEGLSEEEEMILAWLSRRVPQSEIAEWLGITHGAARNRIMRLRARLKDTALRCAARFTGRDREELDEFFRRAYAVGRGKDAAGGSAPGAVTTEPSPPAANQGGRREA